MKKFVKNYIGKGTKVEDLDIIKVNLKIADLVKFAHTYKGEEYVSLEVAKLQTPDKFGHDYTVYVNRLEEVQDAEPAPTPEKKTKKSSKKAKTDPKTEDDLPF